MPRRQKVPFSLVRKRIRPSFNKLNVYNAATWNKNRTYNSQFRQVFFAKQEARSYHGEHLTETQFRNIFRPELTSVSPLQSKAERSGSEDEIPHALQTFVALERRLDFAVFRAMFASSTRQASKFIVGGAVKVNGVRIKQPGYVLQAGDMFSVDPNRVLEALGRQKPSAAEAVTLTNRIIRKYNKYLDLCQKNPEKMWTSRDARRRRHHVFDQKQVAREHKQIEAHNGRLQQEMNAAINGVTPRSILEAVLRGDVLGTGVIAAKGKAVMGLVRPSAQTAPKEASKEAPSEFASTEIPKTTEATEAAPKATEPETASTTPTSEAAEAASEGTKTAPEAAAAPAESADVSSLVDRYYAKTPGMPGVAGKSDVKALVADIVKLRQEALRTDFIAKMRKAGEPAPYDPQWVQRLPAKIAEIDAETSAEELEKIKLNLPFSTSGRVYGLAEPAKRWFTPWTPRQFMAPMAVLPHHLEVSHETCHAVYLRDPVARPGHSEVISPFALDMHERAHMWYFYRRRKNLPRVQ